MIFRECLCKTDVEYRALRTEKQIGIFYQEFFILV